MGSCWSRWWQRIEQPKVVEYSIVYDPELMEPLISKSDFLMRDSVIEAQFGSPPAVEGELSFSHDDGGHA